MPTKWHSSILRWKCTCEESSEGTEKRSRTYKKSLSWSSVLRFEFLAHRPSSAVRRHEEQVAAHQRRLMTSHFSGVVTITLALPISLDVASVESPVSSMTFHPSGANLVFQSRARSLQRLFVGAM